MTILLLVTIVLITPIIAGLLILIINKIEDSNFFNRMLDRYEKITMVIYIYVCCFLLVGMSTISYFILKLLGLAK